MVWLVDLLIHNCGLVNNQDIMLHSANLLEQVRMMCVCVCLNLLWLMQWTFKGGGRGVDMHWRGGYCVVSLVGLLSTTVVLSTTRTSCCTLQTNWIR